MRLNNDHPIKILIDVIDQRLRHQFIGFFVVDNKILDEEKKIAEVKIHLHTSVKQDINQVIYDTKTHMENNYNLTIFKNKNVKQDEILDDIYELRILTMNKYIGGKYNA